MTLGEREIGELVVGLAKGQITLAELAGIDTRDKVKILQYGIAQMSTGRHQEAVQVLEGLVALDQQTPIFHEYLGLAYERAGRLDDALGAYDQTIEQLVAIDQGGEQRLEAHLLRARVQLLRGDKTSAQQDVAEAKRHDVGSDPAVTEQIAQLDRAARGEP